MLLQITENQPVRHIRAEPLLGELLSDGNDQFSCLTRNLTERNKISEQELPDLSLSSFAHRVAGYDREPEFDSSNDFTSNRHALARALLLRGPEQLLQACPPNLLKWLNLNAVPGSAELNVLSDSMVNSGSAVDIAERAEFQDLLANVAAKYRSALPQSDLVLHTRLKELLKTAIRPINASTFEAIKNCLLRNNESVSNLQQSDYQLQFFCVDCGSEGNVLPCQHYRSGNQTFSASPHTDVNFGAVLTYKGVYCSLFSGYPMDDGETFLVVQLQGIKLKPCLSNSDKFTDLPDGYPKISGISSKVSLMTAIDYARQQKFSRIALVPGDMNIWARTYKRYQTIREIPARFSIEEAKRIYNGSARQLKFRLNDSAFGGLHTLNI